ncbi:hypothetical protein [Plantactinospora sp. WMMB782]|uniref:hypothetical protein n=1 Tax=Plantactinospora sp. WMMB782 TaxID=3404121 RepID=UPI003B959ADC
MLSQPESSAPWHIEGEPREPNAPLLPPPGVGVPADITAAHAAYISAYDAWRDATEALDDYISDAQMSRARRADAIRAAGIAEAAGRERPTIPSAVSEEAEAVEAQIKSAVVATRLREANRASDAMTDMVIRHAGRWVAPVSARFPEAIAEARAAIERARAAVDAAASAQTASAWMRAFDHAARLEAAGVSVNKVRTGRLVGAYTDATTTHKHRQNEGYHRAPWHLLDQALRALADLEASNLAAVPHPDTIHASSHHREEMAVLAAIKSESHAAA